MHKGSHRHGSLAQTVSKELLYLMQVGRTGRLHESGVALASLAYSEALVVCSMGDMACTEDSNGLLGDQGVGEGPKHIQWMVHAAGVLQDGALKQQDLAGMRR
jgi:hypothetical protein